LQKALHEFAPQAKAKRWVPDSQSSCRAKVFSTLLWLRPKAALSLFAASMSGRQALSPMPDGAPFLFPAEYTAPVAT